MVQLAVITVVCWAGALPAGVELPATGHDWLSTLYMALVAGAFALVAQTWAPAARPRRRGAAPGHIGDRGQSDAHQAVPGHGAVTTS